MSEFLLGMLSNALGELVADLFGEGLAERVDRRALGRALDSAVARAERQFVAEYGAHDPELVAALTGLTRFADLPSVRAALAELLARPFHDPAAPVAVLRGSFADVLPARVERERVDAAVRAFLAALGREVLYLPQLRELYGLSFSKASAESGRATAEHTAAMARSVAEVAGNLRELRDELRLLAAPADPRLLPAPAAAPAARPRPLHNLPQRSYSAFIGRQAEREQLARLLLPHPRSRHFVVTIDGIGGVGKSALALELAYGYREGYANLPEEERFEAVVWVSAKRTLLTAGGIQQRRQSFNTLDDLFREVAAVHDLPAILQAPAAERRGLVERSLAERRTLLIIDNLETVDDEELLSFLRELPDPTKAIVTTRHRIDIAYAIRLTGMPRDDALRLMAVEAEAKGVALAPAALDELEHRTGGLPLAMIWSIGLMSLGHSVEAVLRRLGQGQSDIARFCFGESAARIAGRDPQRLLLALALFERSVARAMLGEVAGLADDPVGRDEALAELLRLSLVNQKGERFSLLPLTHAFARDELARHPALADALREAWVARLTAMAAPYNQVHWQQPDRQDLRREGEHLVTLAAWAEASGRPDLLLPIAVALGAYYDSVGRWPDMLELSWRCIEYARLLGDRAVLRNELNSAAWIIGQQGRLDEAEALLAEAEALAHELGDAAWLAEIMINSSQLARRRRHFALAQARCEAAEALLASLDDDRRPYVRADVELERGKIARDQGDWAAARDCFERARAVFVIDQDDPRFNSERAWGAYSQLAYVTHKLGDLERAAPMYAKSLEAIRAVGSRGYLATLLVRCAELELERGDRAAAGALLAEAAELSRRLGLVDEQRQSEELGRRLADG